MHPNSQLQFKAQTDKENFAHIPSSIAFQFDAFHNFQQKQHKLQSQREQDQILYTRVARRCLDQQLNIYEWRKNPDLNIIPINCYQIFRSTTKDDEISLLKVSITKYEKTLKTVNRISIGQSLALLQSMMDALKTIFDQFGFYELTEKMVAFDRQGNVKLWMFEDYHVNPGNSLYSKNKQKKSQIKALVALIKLVKKKCIKSKNSSELFNFLSTAANITQLQQKVITYIRSKRIIVPSQVLSPNYESYPSSIASSARLVNASEMTQNQNQSGLKTLGVQNQIQKQEDHRQIVKASEITKTHSGFIEISPFSKKQADKQISEDKKKMINSVSSPSLKISLTQKKLSLKSCVFSQKIEGKSKKQQTEEHVISQWVLQRNGWEQNILNLPLHSESILKQSIESENEGEQKQFHGLQLKKLHTMGGSLVRSFLPVEEECSSDF